MDKNKSLTEKILEIIWEGVVTTGEVIATILESGYGASYSKLDKNFREKQRRKVRRELIRQEQQRFYSLLSKLKSEGFIQSKSKRWKITISGKRKLKSLRESEVNQLPSRNYRREGSPEIVVVTFDIPEREKHKRRWLGSTLQALGFTRFQKSVWIGKVKIPEEFIEDLRFMKIDRCVHIFSAGRLGTIDIG